MKRLGTILAFIGSLWAFVASLSYFFSGQMMGAMNYNYVEFSSREEFTIIGIFILILAIVSLLLSLLAFKHHYNRKLFISLIVIGIIIIILGPFIAGLLIMLGGLLGLLGVITTKKAQASS